MSALTQLRVPLGSELRALSPAWRRPSPLQTSLQRLTHAHKVHEKVTSLVRKMPIKVTVRDHSHCGNAISQQNKCWRGCGEMETSVHCWLGCIMMQMPWKAEWSFLGSEQNYHVVLHSHFQAYPPPHWKQGLEEIIAHPNWQPRFKHGWEVETIWCPLMDQWICTMCSAHKRNIIDIYLEKRKGILTQATTWMSVEDLMLSESQKQR